MGQGPRVKAGYVLAGGASSRMGRDKALLPWRGATLLDYVAGEVRAAAGSVAVVGSAGRYRDRGYPEIPDIYPGTGPLGGVASALHGTPATWNLIVACDMPGVTAAFLQVLLEEAQSRNADCLLPVGPGGLPEPLCGVWHQRCEPGLVTALEHGVLKMTDAIHGLEVAWFPVAEPAVFQNLNTPEDWLSHTEAMKPA